MEPVGVFVELIPFRDLLWTVPAEIGGERANFLLDTGAGITLVETALAERVGIERTGSFSGRRMSGEVVEVDLGGGREISIAGTVIDHDDLGVATETCPPLSVRPVTDGPSLDLFVEVKSADRSLWFEVDTGNAGPAMVAPAAAEALGQDPGATDVQEFRLELVGHEPVATPAVVAPIVHDGVLGLAFLNDRVLTLDLPTERAWIG